MMESIDPLVPQVRKNRIHRSVSVVLIQLLSFAVRPLGRHRDSIVPQYTRLESGSPYTDPPAH